MKTRVATGVNNAAVVVYINGKVFQVSATIDFKDGNGDHIGIYLNEINPSEEKDKRIAELEAITEGLSNYIKGNKDVRSN